MVEFSRSKMFFFFLFFFFPLVFGRAGETSSGRANLPTRAQRSHKTSRHTHTRRGRTPTTRQAQPARAAGGVVRSERDFTCTLPTTKSTHTNVCRRQEEKQNNSENQRDDQRKSFSLVFVLTVDSTCGAAKHTIRCAVTFPISSVEMQPECLRQFWCLRIFTCFFLW